MKTEEPAQAVPTTQTYSTQWATPSMAIDPALQQQTTAAQYYSAYASHYPQTAYATHYQAYAPSGTAAQQPKPVTAAQAYNLGSSAANTTANNAIDTSDINTLKDALGSAGVDLRAEEESLQRTQSDSTHQAYRSYDDRTRKQPPKPSFDTRILGATMRTIGTNHKISRIPEESVSYLALSLRARLQDLITAMIAAAHHRTDITFDRPATLYEDNSPMWSIVIKSDVAKQLAALEKVEREEETKIRKERKERADLQAAHAAALAAQANGASSASAAGMGLGGGIAGGSGDGAGGAFGGDEQEGGGKKKRKKDGPGVTARNMSEDARKKMSNAVATQAAGLGGKYAWMTATNSATATPPKPKPPVAAAVSTTSAITAASAAATVSPTTLISTGALSSWARPYVPTTKKSTSSKEETLEHDTRTTITIRDAMFVIEKERGHGGGRGAARGWT